MAGLPPLLAEDVAVFDAALSEFLKQSEAVLALIIDKGGPVIAQRGSNAFDVTTIAALAAGAFSATQAIAQCLDERGFSNIYQQGARHSLLMGNIDDDTLLVMIFKVETSVGAVRYFSTRAVETIRVHLEKARLRSPQTTIDLVSMNIVDAAGVFRRKN